MPEQQQRYHHGNLRQELLIAAEQELREHGVEGLSMRSVAKRAGVSHAAPAHHFGDAKGLLTELAALGFERILALKVKRGEADNKQGLDKLVAEGMAYIEFAQENPELFRLMFGSKLPEEDNQELAAKGEATFMRLIGNLNIKPETIDEDKSLVKILKAWGLVHGLSELMISCKPKILADKQNSDIESLLEKTLRDAFQEGI